MEYLVRRVAFSLLTACLFSAAASSVSAQVPTQQPVPPAGDTKTIDPVMIADVNIYDATIVRQTGNAFQVFFKLSNGKGAQSDIHYAVQLSKTVMVDGNRNRIFADEKIYPDSVSLNSDTTLPQQLTYEAPAYLAGTYDLTLMSRNANGLVLGFSDLGEVTLSGTGQYVEVKGDTCFLTVEGENGQPHYDLFQGVDIDSSETLDLTCTLENHTKTNVTMTPSFAMFLRSTFGQEIAGTTGMAVQPIALKASEQKAVTVPLPRATVPQAYDIVASFTTTENVPVTSVPLHYVLRGIGATVSNLILDKIVYAKGDTARISFVWMGPADNFPESRGKNPAAIGNVFSLVRVADVSGAACGGETKTPLDPNLPRQEISYAVTADCLSPQVDAEVIDANGKVLATSQFRFKTPEGVTPTPSIQTRQMTTTGADNSMTLLRLMVVALALIAVFLGVLIRKGKGTMKKSRNRRPPGAVITFLLVGFSIAAFAASAQHAAAGTFSTPYGWYANGWVEFSYNNNSANIGHGGSITGTLWASGANSANHLTNGYTWGSVGIDGGVGWVGLRNFGWNGWNISNTYWPGDGWHNIHYGGRVNFNESFQDQGFYTNPVPGLSLWADSYSIAAGTSPAIRWRSWDSNVNYEGLSCTINFWNQSNMPTAPLAWRGEPWWWWGNGDYAPGAIWGDTTYTVTCYNAAWQSTSASVTVHVIPNPSIGWFYPETNPVDYGAQSVLNWGTSNATYCYMYGGIFGGGVQVPCSGRWGTSGLTTATGYWFAAYNSAWVGVGVGTTVFVNPQPVVPAPVPAISINGSHGPLGVNANDTLTITWGAVANATGCTASGIGWTGAKAVGGGTEVIVASTSSNYSLTCSGNGGTGSDTITVNVATLPLIPGACGSGPGNYCANGTTYAGNDNGLTACGTNRTWTCNGLNGGAPASCSVPNVACAACGPAAHTYPGSATALSGATCGTGSTFTGGNTTLPADATPISWTCQGQQGDTLTCTAAKVCATNCATQATSHCGAFTTVNSCNITENCSGTKTVGCNTSWKEVAP